MALSILLVDDDPTFLLLATEILNEVGAEVVGYAQDAATAISAADALQPDAVIVDIGLPDRDGVELGYELAALPWRPQVVLTSSDSDAACALTSRDDAGTLAFLPKEQFPSAALGRLLAVD